MWQPASQMNSSPGRQCRRTPIWFDIVPEGTNTAASLPSSSAIRRCRRVDRGVVVENVVAHLGRGHRGPHGRRGLGDGIAAKIEHFVRHS